MLEHMSQAVEPLGQMVGTVGALGSFLSFVLAIYLEWGNIRARAKGRTRRVKGRAPMRGQPASQAIIETEPALRVPVGRHAVPTAPKTSIAGLIARLFFDLVKTTFAIFMAIVISAEYLLLANHELGIGLPRVWLLVASLALGAILGAYLRARSWFLLVLIGVISQVGILALMGWSLRDVSAILEVFVSSGVVAGLY
jgi:hypothetical protein